MLGEYNVTSNRLFALRRMKNWYRLIMKTDLESYVIGLLLLLLSVLLGQALFIYYLFIYLFAGRGCLGSAVPVGVVEVVSSNPACAYK